MPSNYEYYCHNCEELILSIGTIMPLKCKSCGSDKISIGEPGNDALTKLRFGDKAPDAPITAIKWRGLTPTSESSPSSTDVLSSPDTFQVGLSLPSSKTAKTEPPK